MVRRPPSPLSPSPRLHGKMGGGRGGAAWPTMSTIGIGFGLSASRNYLGPMDPIVVGAIAGHSSGSSRPHVHSEHGLMLVVWAGRGVREDPKRIARRIAVHAQCARGLCLRM